MKKKVVFEFNGSQTPNLEESEVINQKFIELINTKDRVSQFQDARCFTPEQIQVISKRFAQFSSGQTMSYEQFRRGLGLLGREDSFICRIFNLIDEDHDGLVTQQNFITYLSVILRGTQFEKARFGWMILTEGKGDLEIKDFTRLFQQISVVWNALTGEVIVPRKKYIEQVFNTFDVDQDQTITFKDYRVFFNQRLLLFGWFQYFNSIEIDEQTSKMELQKVQQRLRDKLKLEPRAEQSLEQIKTQIKDQQTFIEKKLKNLTNGLRNAAVNGREGVERVKMAHSRGTIRDFQKSVSSTKTKASTESTPISLKSLFKYNHHESTVDISISRIRDRRSLQAIESRQDVNAEVMQDLNKFIEESCKLIELCSSYRSAKQKLRRYSPTKMKQMEAKLSALDQSEKEDEKGQMSVYFGHESWNLVLNIMVGLRKSIKSLYNLSNFSHLKEADFSSEHEFMLGNKALNGRQDEVFKNLEIYKFIQVAPFVFQRLRLNYGVSNEAYQKSVGPESLLNHLLTGNLTALNQKCSTGKSGAFFYLTVDSKVFLKTLKKDEFTLFTNILAEYYKHMTSYQDTLLVRIYGLYKLKIYVNKEKIDTIYFIAMENIFADLLGNSHLKIQEVYDLKGSLYDRNGTQGKELKDNDWINNQRKFNFAPEVAEIFKRQVKLDSKLFKHCNINDYSLMVAIVNCPSEVPISNNEQNVFKRMCGGVASRSAGKMYVISIIDFLTVFQTKKNLEYFFKTTFLSKDVSCIPPAEYAVRFREFLLNALE